MSSPDNDKRLVRVNELKALISDRALQYQVQGESLQFASEAAAKVLLKARVLTMRELKAYEMEHNLLVDEIQKEQKDKQITVPK